MLHLAPGSPLSSTHENEVLVPPGLLAQFTRLSGEPYILWASWLSLGALTRSILVCCVSRYSKCLAM